MKHPGDKKEKGHMEAVDVWFTGWKIVAIDHQEYRQPPSLIHPVQPLFHIILFLPTSPVTALFG